MSGKGVWFSVVSFATAIGWIVSSERETVRSGGLWALAGREAVTAETPKKAPPEGSVVRSPPRPPSLCAAGADRAPAPAPGAHHRPGQQHRGGQRQPAQRDYADAGAAAPVRAPLHRRGAAALRAHRRAVDGRRVVEQYLWHEVTKGRKHKMQIHTYHKVRTPGRRWARPCADSHVGAPQGWSSRPIDSTKFVDDGPHVNPPTMPVRSVSIAAPGVKVRPAALPLSPSLPLSLSRARVACSLPPS